MCMIKVVIMAGGKGTRIRNEVKHIPKPMIDICGKPLLERQLEWLISQGINEVTIIVGYLGHLIIDHFKTGEKLGISIKYITEIEPLGTFGGLYYIRRESNQTILLINGDIMLDIDIQRLLNHHKNKNAEITLLTHPNDHPFDSALISTDENGRIVKWINKEDVRCDYKNRVNAGIHVIESNTLDFMLDNKYPVNMDLDRDFLKPNIQKYKIFSYDTPEYVKDIGTPDRYHRVQEDFHKGLTNKKNLTQKQRAIFLDRDGTVIKYKGFITKPEQIELIEGAAKAIRGINESGRLAILVTNQPVIARGECTVEELLEIHNRIERLLGEKGAFIDDVYYCPHHPDKGFPGERLEYKIDCECRKPKPGLIYQAAERYNIDIAESIMIGDSVSDIEAGKRAGCMTGYIGDVEFLGDVVPDYVGENLVDITERILS